MCAGSREENVCREQGRKGVQGAGKKRCAGSREEKVCREQGRKVDIKILFQSNCEALSTGGSPSK
jgi:hypothetical protein